METTTTNTTETSVKTAQTLILGREDMVDTQNDKDISTIEQKDFKVPMFLFSYYDIVLFIDNDRQTKFIKNRFGNI
jgi:hypothetical protein